MGRLRLVLPALAAPGFGALCWYLLACRQWSSCMSPGQAIRSVAEAEVAAIAVFGSILLAWAALATVRIARASRKLRTFGIAPAGGVLEDLAESAGIARLTRIDDPSLAAFCSGIVCPTVYVTSGLVGALAAEELLAVLVHEQHHALRREPLRKLLREALVTVLFFLPIVAWWAERKALVSELRADADALRRVGAPSVARAMWALDAGTRYADSVAFGNADGLRVAQVLGDPVSDPLPPLKLVLASGMGLVALIAMIVCLRGVATLLPQ